MKWAVLILVFLFVVLSADFDVCAKEGTDFIFLPDAYFLADFASLSGSDLGFTALARKIIGIHIARYGAFDATFLVHERLLISERFDEKSRLYRIEYLMEYFNLSRRFSGFSFGILFDHICYNIIDVPEDTDAFQLRWYGIGLQLFTSGMSPTGKMVMHPEYAPGFCWLLKPNFFFSASFPLHTEQFDYTCRAKGVIRFDLCVFLCMVPYLQAETEALVDDDVRFDRILEAGVSATLHSVTFSVYSGYQYRNDALLYRGGSDESWMFGIRAETLIGDEKESPMPRNDDEQNFPTIRFSGGYGKRIGSAYLGYFTELGADLDAFRYESWVLVLSADTEHYSKAQDNSLFPRYINFSFGGGIEYFFTENYYTTLSYERVVRCDGNAYRGSDERYQILGINFATRGMRRGEENYADAIMHDGFISRLEYQLFAGWYPQREGWGYDAEYRAALRFDVIRWGLCVFYTETDGKLYYGDQKDYRWGFEGGVRMSFGLTLMLYCRYERMTDINRYAGAAERSAIIGFRVSR